MWSRMSRRSSRALCDQLTLTVQQLGLYSIVPHYALSLDVGDASLDLLLHVELVHQIVPRSVVTKTFDNRLSCFLDRRHDLILGLVELEQMRVHAKRGVTDALLQVCLPDPDAARFHEAMGFSVIETGSTYRKDGL